MKRPLLLALCACAALPVAGAAAEPAPADRPTWTAAPLLPQAPKSPAVVAPVVELTVSRVGLPYAGGGDEGAFYGSATAGVRFLPLLGGRLRTEATLGFAVARGENLNYRALPLEVLETIDLGPLRLGAGAYAVLTSTVTGSGAAPIDGSWVGLDAIALLGPIGLRLVFKDGGAVVGSGLVLSMSFD